MSPSRPAAVLLAAVAVLAACGGGDDGLEADATTAKLAAVQAQHLCNVAETNFPTEDAIKKDLVALLDAEGFEYEEWKDWHDSLVDSPDRAEQLAEETAKGCG